MLKNLMKFLKRLLKSKIIGPDEIVAFIGKGDVLPKALTATEELELMERLSKGDEEASNELIEHNLRLVVYIAKKFENFDCDLEDLISVGAVGLIKAVHSFNTEKNIKLATYASRCIENEILMHLRKTSKQSLEISLDEPLSFDKDGNELLLSDVIEGEDESSLKEMEKTSEKNLLWKAISKLSLREQKIMELRFGLCGNEENTQKEVAELLGISQSYISRIEKKILSRLKKDISKLTAS